MDIDFSLTHRHTHITLHVYPPNTSRNICYAALIHVAVTRIRYTIVDPIITKDIYVCLLDTIDSTSIRNSFRQLHFMRQK